MSEAAGKRWKLGDPTKWCSACGATKRVDEFQRRRKDGGPYQSRCRDCQNSTNRAWAKSNRSRASKNVRAWRSGNLDRAQLSAARWRNDNRQKIKAYQQRHYWRNPDLHRTRARQWKDNNTERAKFNCQRWRKSNPGRNAHKAMLYEARKRRATPPWVDLKAIEAVYVACAELNASSGRKHHVDHIYPLCSPVMCGLHVPWNLQILPADVNQRKSNKVNDPWLMQAQ